MARENFDITHFIDVAQRQKNEIDKFSNQDTFKDDFTDDLLKLASVSILNFKIFIIFKRIS